MSGYINVYQALEKVRRYGTALGSVVNGATVEEDDCEHKRRKKKPTDLEKWGRNMGALYENFATYTAFAVGGQETTSYNSPYDVATTQLQVVKDGVVVKAWALHEPLPVDELLPFCAMADNTDPKAQATVVDATVRTAMELPSDAFVKLQGGAAAKPGTTFRLVGVELAKDGSCKILDADQYRHLGFVVDVQRAVRDKLVCVDFTMVPYKLNVCSAGGLLNPHVDTPAGTLHSARRIGTAVVALPSAFKGGAFSVREPSDTAAGRGGGGGAAAATVVSRGVGAAVVAAAAATPGGDGAPTATTAPTTAATTGSVGAGSVAVGERAAVCTFNWAPASAGTEAVQWAAFLGDYVHDVEPVTAGHRVTVTYAIMAADGTRTAKGADTKIVSRKSFGRWDKLAEPSVVAPTSSVSALHLERFLDQVAACPVTTFGILLTQQYTFTSVEPASLKGMDRVVYDTLVRAGLRVTLRPVVYSTHVTGPHYYGYDNGHSSNDVYAFDAADVARLCAATKDGKKGPAGIPFVRCSAAKFGRLRSDEPVGVCLQNIYTLEEGRQSEEDERLYFAAALIVSK